MDKATANHAHLETTLITLKPSHLRRSWLNISHCSSENWKGKPVIGNPSWRHNYVPRSRSHSSERHCRSLFGNGLPGVFCPMDVSLGRCEIAVSERRHDLGSLCAGHRHMAGERVSQAMKTYALGTQPRRGPDSTSS